jgi:hypothetical protein
MNTTSAQSWFDFPVMQPMDIRSLVQTASLQDNGGTLRAATFSRSSTWLVPGPWVSPVVGINVGGTVPNISVPNTYDYQSIEAANEWNTLHQMAAPNAVIIPAAVSKIMFLKAGTAFVNNLYLDWTPGKTSQLVQLSFRDNSVTSGDFQNAGTGTIPALLFPTTATYGGINKNFQVTLLQKGRFQVGMLVLDNAGNMSMYEMDWIVL